MNYKLEKFTHLVEALQELPSIGKKSATRLAYHMLINDSFSALKLAHAIENAVGSLKKCYLCGGLSEDELCSICSDESRDSNVLCIVENAKDILIIEENGIYTGKYFVLEALDVLDIEHLKSLIQNGVDEVIFALTPSISNDTVMLFIEEKLINYNVKFTRIAQGVPTGVSLENIDMLSLSRAIEDRIGI